MKLTPLLRATIPWVAGAVLAVPARAEPPVAEFRLFLDATARDVPVVQPFARSESRLRTEGLVYEKLSAGLRSKVAEWLKVEAYLSDAEKLPEGSRDGLVVGNLGFGWDFGAFAVGLRSGHEWHTQGFYRYRQLHELRWRPTDRASLWLNDEVRVDSDEGRMTMNNARIGVDLSTRAKSRLRVVIDLESSRRGGDSWNWVVAPGVVLQAGL
ncbi:MAG: hypothetical protein D6798_06605 [Deltaproteobacteria bacterium]|nr:MAG: hypothetical protein D6798_06605 [Deltaproteobacteria bacterium]